MDDSDSTNESVLLDPQTSDLNLIIDKECLLAYPMSEEGFCSMWAGCRANYGIDSGKVAFEINLDDYCECPDLPKDDSEAFLIRVGWSIAYSPLQLGENQFSFAYCNNGKKCTDKLFEDFGSSFEKGDSVAAYIDFETDKESIQFSFSKNGIDQGVAFVINKNELKKKFEAEYTQDLRFLFFPHVLTKNVVFEVNFGQRVSLIGDEPFAPIKSDFLLIQKVAIEKRFCLDLTADDKTSQEVIILIGLPHVGKTNWALNYAKNNAKKFYYIIGVSSIVDKMKISAKKAQQLQQQQQQQQKVNEKQNLAQASSETSEASTSDEATSSQQTINKAQYELLDKVLKCMNVLIEIASQTNRNIILDQPNVYESTRRRKLKQFENWKRRAVVIVPEDQVYLDRMAAAEKNGKEICISLIDDMKTNFTLPKPCEYIDSVEYVELNEEEATKVIEIYNKEGLINRQNTVVNRRQKTKQAILKIIASKLGTMPPNIQPPNKQGFRMSSPANQYQPAFTNDAVRFNRYSSPSQLNPPRRGYPNQPYRMNRYPPSSNPYPRPQLYGFGVQQPAPVATYGVNQQWPAATSTELWSQQQQQQHLAQFQAATAQNQWTPALPISSNVSIIPNPSYTTSWNPNKNDLTKK